MNNSRLRRLRTLWALGPNYGLEFLFLTPKAFFSRLREGRSPFAPTLPYLPQPLPRASLAGRVLPQERYLRPTPFCDCHAPEVIALADRFREESENDWEYAQKIYDFVRNEIIFAHEAPPRNGVVGTLRRGYGICIDKLNLLIALARAGDIPARYCTIGDVSAVENASAFPRVQLTGRFLDEVGSGKGWDLRRRILASGQKRLIELQERTVSESGSIKSDGMAELKIGDIWVPADPTWEDAEAAALGLPLPRLGYDPLTMRGLIGCTTERSEALPLGRSFWISRHIVCLLLRGTHDYLNRVLEKARAHGRRQLAGVGREAYIKKMKRFYLPVPGLASIRKGAGFHRVENGPDTSA